MLRYKEVVYELVILFLRSFTTLWVDATAAPPAVERWAGFCCCSGPIKGGMRKRLAETHRW